MNKPKLKNSKAQVVQGKNLILSVFDKIQCRKLNV